MSTSTDDTQFNCRLCSFIGTSKAEIAEHFLTEHIEQYVSLSKASSSKPSKSDESPTKEDKAATESPKQQVPEAVEDVENETGGDDSKTDPKKSKTLDEILKQKLEGDADGDGGLGRGMRRRKRATPVKYSMDDEEEEEEWSPKKDSEPSKTIYVKAPSILAKGKGRGRKKGKRGRPPGLASKKQKSKGVVQKKVKEVKARESRLTSTAKPESEIKKKTGNLPIPFYVVNRILDDQVEDWFKKYKEKRDSIEMIRCPNDRCANVMTKEEMEVHEKCHVPNLDGFRCCGCSYMSLHWAKMRVHYRTEHNPKLNAAYCDFEECSKIFSCVGAKLLQSHALKAHFKPKLMQKLKSRNFDRSEYEKYMREPENEADRESMASKKARKRSAESDNDDDDNENDIDDNDDSEMSEPEKKKEKTETKRKKFKRYKVHVCPICLSRFKDIAEMTEHKEKHNIEGNTEVVSCAECNHSGSTTEIQEHVASEHKRMLHLHRCPECNKFSTNHYHDLKKHLVTHTGAKNYMCELCGRRTTTPFNLRIHYRRIHATEDEKKHTCGTCDFKCADKGILKEHIKHKHGLLLNKDSYGRPKPTPIFSCPHCEYVGRKPRSLEYHMRIHKENRQFKCQLCPYASKTKNNLVLHVRTHEGLQPNKCPHCEFRGATNKIVSEHIMSKHAKVRPYRCNICGWTAAYNGNMWKHIEGHQKLLGNEMPEFPVSVLSGIDDLSMPTALRAPSGKKRGLGVKSSSPSKPKGKAPRTKFAESPSGVILANRQVGQEIPVVVSSHLQELQQQQQPLQQQPETQLQPQQIPQQSTPQPQAQPPQPQTQQPPQALQPQIINPEGMVIQMINVEPSHDGQHIVKVTGDGSQIRHHQLLEYSVPPVSVTQQIIASGSDMAHVIADQQHYHHQHHHQQQQQQQPHQHALQHPQPSHTPHSAPQLIQQPQPKPIPMEIHTVSMPPGTQSNPVPTPVVEQIVRDPEHAVHHLVAAMMPRWN